MFNHMMDHVIHVLTLSESPERNPISGAENQVLLLLSALAKQVINVTLVLGVWSQGPTPIIDKEIIKLRLSGVKVFLVQRKQHSTFLSGKWQTFLALRKVYKVLKPYNCGIIHLHMDTTWLVLTSVLSGFRRIVVTLHCDAPEYRSLTCQKIWHPFCKLIGVRFVGITRHVSSYFEKIAGLAPGSVTTIHYGITTPIGPLITRRELNVKDTRFVVGFVGRLEAQKNLLELVKAANKLPNIDFVLIGEGTQKQSILDLIKDLGLNNIHMIGVLPGASRAMKAFDLFCLPSKYEGLGLVLLEAMIQQVPVLGSNIGAIREVLCNGMYGHLTDGNSNAIAEAIKRLSEDAQLRNELAQRAYRHVLTDWTVTSLIDKTLNFYRSIEGNDSSGRCSERAW